MSTQTALITRAVSHLQHRQDILLNPLRMLQNASQHRLAVNVLAGAALALTAAEAAFKSSLLLTAPKNGASIWSGATAGGSLLIVWATWAAALYVGVMLLGGRSRFDSLFRVVIFAWLPYCVLTGLRLTYLLATRQQIACPGLSGFVPVNAGTASLGQVTLIHFLTQVHFYLFWHLLLLAFGAHVVGRLSMSKALGLVIVCWSSGTLLTFLPQLILRILAF